MAHCRGRSGEGGRGECEEEERGNFRLDITKGSVLKWSIANRNFAESAC